MALLKHIKRLKYIDYIIKRKATGDLEHFAEKNGLSKRAMTDVLSEMKELGFPIKYDRSRNTYYYDEAGEMVKNLFIKDGQILSKEQISKIGLAENLCFSEVTIFEVCENI
ncbi:hypothetical protein SAMN05216464_12630 [Mucilaginibacter pineti]|uniref:HTH domain-containing protein n=1 Tax=Mucilaginibacter pineti TaxID=1391627 RepID=A0A1G7NE15_9SPHI|nr:hypothetical protein [Mucilaginibacter pineti]SDF72273.1 hypothetical protein SAMN05216464_12630 [Mucilaginibacter pineti]